MIIINKRKFNTFLNYTIFLFFAIGIFMHTDEEAEIEAGFENAGGYISYVDEGGCTCPGKPTYLGTPFTSKGPRGGDYIDPTSATHYDRGAVGSNTLTHISKTSFSQSCQVENVDPKKPCVNHTTVPSGRVVLFGGTSTK